MRIDAVLILLFTLTAGTASAGAGCLIQANDFHTDMNEFAKYRRGQDFDAPKALGYTRYVSAVFDGLIGLEVICVDNISVGDVGDVVLRRFDDWMKAKSFLPSQTCAYTAVFSVLLERFPCDPKPPAK